MPINEDQKCSMGKIKTQRLYLSYSIHTILRKDKQKLKKLRNKLKEKKEKNLLINQKLMQEQMLNFSTTEVDKISKQEMLTTIFIINPHGMRRKIEIPKR
jgi:hypothetical protein